MGLIVAEDCSIGFDRLAESGLVSDTITRCRKLYISLMMIPRLRKVQAHRRRKELARLQSRIKEGETCMPLPGQDQAETCMLILDLD